MGVLGFANHKGAWVREVSLVETLEALEVKAALEAQAAVSKNYHPPDFCKELRQLAHEIIDSAKRREFADYQKLNQSFHRTIVVAAENRTLLRLWDSLAFEVRTRPIMEFLQENETPVVAREHLTIVKALEGGDRSLVATLLVEHVSRLAEHLRFQIDLEARTPVAPASRKALCRTSR
jgi:DNA-binding GntR family transcriptional regulator